MGFVMSPKVCYKNGMSYKINNFHDDDVFESGSGVLRGAYNRPGVNSEGFIFKSAMVKTNVFHFIPPEQICPFEKFWSGSADPTVTSDPLYNLRERPKMINVNLIFAMVKMHSQ